MSSQRERRIVLVGKTGVGKSSAGNSILGEDRFPAGFSSSSLTKQCQKQSAVISGKKWTVVDTPDFLLTHDDDEVERSLELSAPGIHAFLFILTPSPFTEQEAEIVSQFIQRYGEEAYRYTIVLFTRGDQVEASELETLISQNQSLMNLVNQCGGRFHVLNNKNPADRQQVYLLLEKIDRMVSANENSCYTLETLQEAKRRAEEREPLQREAVDRARRETETRVRKEKEDEIKKLEAQIAALKMEKDLENKERDPEHKAKSQSLFQLKYFCVVAFFSLAVGFTLSKGSPNRASFLQGCAVGGSAGLMGGIMGKVLVVLLRSSFKTSCSSPQPSSNVFNQSMKKMFGLLCGGAAGLLIGYANSRETCVILLAGLAGASGAFSAVYKSC